MKKRSLRLVVRMQLVCLLACCVAAVLTYWGWRRDESGGRQALIKHKSLPARLQHWKYVWMADARTLASALHYLAEAEPPASNQTSPFRSAVAMTNVPSGVISMAQTQLVAASNSVPLPVVDAFATNRAS